MVYGGCGRELLILVRNCYDELFIMKSILIKWMKLLRVLCWSCVNFYCIKKRMLKLYY